MTLFCSSVLLIRIIGPVPSLEAGCWGRLLDAPLASQHWKRDFQRLLQHIALTLHSYADLLHEWPCPSCAYTQTPIRDCQLHKRHPCSRQGHSASVLRQGEDRIDMESADAAQMHHCQMFSICHQLGGRFKDSLPDTSHLTCSASRGSNTALTVIWRMAGWEIKRTGLRLLAAQGGEHQPGHSCGCSPTAAVCTVFLPPQLRVSLETLPRPLGLDVCK